MFRGLDNLAIDKYLFIWFLFWQSVCAPWSAASHLLVTEEWDKVGEGID